MNWEMITGVASLVIALCALVFSIWQGFQVRKHNKMAFRPHLSSWSHSQHDKDVYIVELLNNGLGPAVIKNFTIKVDGKKISGEGTELMEKAIKALFPDMEFNYQYGHLGEKYAMGAKEKRTLLSIQFLDDELPPSDDIKRTLSRADLEVEYESFYGEKFFLSTANESHPK